MAMLLAGSSSIFDLDPGMVWAVAMVAPLTYAIRCARQSQLDARAMYWACVCACFGGLWGGHIMGLFVHGWSGDPMALLRFWDSSKSYYGGLLGGGLAAALLFRRWKLPVLAYADAGVPAVARGYAIGRIGCFLNGDDYGTLTRLRWAVVFPSGTEAYTAHLSNGWIRPGDSWSLPVHPTQLYASLLGLGLFAILGSWRAKRPGDRLWLFFLLYGASRFLLEYFRGDFHPVLGALSLPQLFSLGLIAAGIILGTRGRGWFVWRTGRLVADPGTAVIS